MEAWPLLLGWPAVAIMLVLSAIGIKRRKAVWLFVGAGLLLPISIYLATTPRFGWLGLAVPLLVAGAGVAVIKRRTKVALALHVPVVAVFGYLAVLVISQ